MNNQPPTENQSNPDTKTQPTVLRCLTGASIASGLAIALYSLTASIAQSFAAKPLHSDSAIVLRISAAVRTLVVGVSTLATGVFGLVAIGLVALAIQVLIQQLKTTPPDVD